MNLKDLTNDLNDVANALAKKYGTTITGKVALNPENLNELILTMYMSTTTVPKTVEPEKTEEKVETIEKRKRASKKAVTNEVKG